MPVQNAGEQKKMKIIRNPRLYWPRLNQLINEIAKAHKQRKKRSHLEREARAIRTAIIAYELRNER
jgi:hypothetical protein